MKGIWENILSSKNTCCMTLQVAVGIGDLLCRFQGFWCGCPLYALWVFCHPQLNAILHLREKATVPRPSSVLFHDKVILMNPSSICMAI